MRNIDSRFELVQVGIFEYFPPRSAGENIIGLRRLPICGLLVFLAGIEFRPMIVGTHRARRECEDAGGRAQPEKDASDACGADALGHVPASAGPKPRLPKSGPATCAGGGLYLPCFRCFQ